MRRDAPMNIRESFGAMVIAIIIEPITTKGARVTSRINIATPC